MEPAFDAHQTAAIRGLFEQMWFEKKTKTFNAQWKVRDPVNEPPAWNCPIRHNDNWADPRLNSNTGFHCTNDHSVPFHIIADFGAFVKIREVLLKKRGDQQHIERVIHQFKLEYWRKNAWVEHGIFDT